MLEACQRSLSGMLLGALQTGAAWHPCPAMHAPPAPCSHTPSLPPSAPCSSPTQVKDEISKYKVGAPARVGLLAPNDVTIPAGSTGMDPSQTSFFQALAIATKINKGERHELCCPGRGRRTGGAAEGWSWAFGGTWLCMFQGWTRHAHPTMREPRLRRVVNTAYTSPAWPPQVPLRLWLMCT